MKLFLSQEEIKEILLSHLTNGRNINIDDETFKFEYQNDYDFKELTGCSVEIER